MIRFTLSFFSTRWGISRISCNKKNQESTLLFQLQICTPSTKGASSHRTPCKRSTLSRFLVNFRCQSRSDMTKSDRKPTQDRLRTDSPKGVSQEPNQNRKPAQSELFFSGTNNRTGTGGTVARETKPEPEPYPSAKTVLKFREAPFPEELSEPKPELLEPFSAHNVTELTRTRVSLHQAFGPRRPATGVKKLPRLEKSKKSLRGSLRGVPADTPKRVKNESPVKNR